MNEPCLGCREYVDRVVDRLTGMFAEQLRERFAGSDRHHEQRLGYEIAIITQRLDEMDRALALQRDLAEEKLKLQSKEYERRLSILNNEHERSERMMSMVVQRETWDQFMKTYEEFRLETYTRLTAISTRAAVWTSALGIIFIIINLLLEWQRLR